MRRLLITGAAGNIGSVLRAGLRGSAEVIRLMDVRPLEVEAGEELVIGDVRSLEDARRALTGCDAVVHLAGIADEAEFDAILDTNIRGTYSVFEAARLEGCRRVVFASSNHAIGYYPVGQVVGTDAPVRPDSWTWLSHGDAIQLVQRSLEAPDVGFLIVFGVSANRRSWWTREGWDRIGYAPHDDAESFAEEVGEDQPYSFHGGEFTKENPSPLRGG